MIEHLVTDRWGGVSQAPYHEFNIAHHVGDDPRCVERNRELLKKTIGVEKIIFANQIHSATIVYVGDPSLTPTCDGLITDKTDIALAIMSADCYGVLLKAEHAIAALHAGRAGAMKGIVSKAIEMMREDFGEEKIEAIISPGIGVCCYEVGEEILSQCDPVYVRGTHLDIKAMIVDQLKRYGAEYHDYGICTCCNPDYYSYRREGVTGRFASVIWRRA